MKITDTDIDAVIDEIHERIKESEPQEGEFTTAQYAERYKLTKRDAYRKLERAEEMGIVARRQYAPKYPVFWRLVKPRSLGSVREKRKNALS